MLCNVSINIVIALATFSKFVRSHNFPNSRIQTTRNKTTTCYATPCNDFSSNNLILLSFFICSHDLPKFENPEYTKQENPRDYRFSRDSTLQVGPTVSASYFKWLKWIWCCARNKLILWLLITFCLVPPYGTAPVETYCQIAAKLKENTFVIYCRRYCCIFFQFLCNFKIFRWPLAVPL